VLYLDIALEAAIRSLVEANMESLKKWANSCADSRSEMREEVLSDLMCILAACLHNTCMAFGSNQELVLCLKDLQVSLVRPRHGDVQNWPSLLCAKNSEPLPIQSCSKQPMSTWQ
jgi:hypothetical protein